MKSVLYRGGGEQLKSKCCHGPRENENRKGKKTDSLRQKIKVLILGQKQKNPLKKGKNHPTLEDHILKLDDDMMKILFKTKAFKPS